MFPRSTEEINSLISKGLKYLNSSYWEKAGVLKASIFQVFKRDEVISKHFDYFKSKFFVFIDLSYVKVPFSETWSHFS